MKIRFQVRSRALDASRIWHDFSIGFYYDFRQEQKYHNPRFLYYLRSVCFFKSLDKNLYHGMMNSVVYKNSPSNMDCFFNSYNKKTLIKGVFSNGVHGRIRTCDRTLRRRVLYPAELRRHLFFNCSYIIA